MKSHIAAFFFAVAVPLSAARADVVTSEISVCSQSAEWSPCSTSSTVGSCQKSSCYHRGSSPRTDAGGWDTTPWPCLVCKPGGGGCSSAPSDSAAMGLGTAGLSVGLGLFLLLRRRARGPG
ncbi:MAG TPA: hypothetical protein VGK67_06445 [Myxococcales bacterium]